MSETPDLLRHLLGSPLRPDGSDGFGQRFFEDFRFISRARKLRKTPMEWRKPSRDEEQQILADPFLGAFADDAIALAWHDGHACLVLERMWHGFPDPPRYAVFAMLESKIRLAADFHDWPACWMLPGRQD